MGNQVTLVDLYKVLGDSVSNIIDDSKTGEDRERVIENATMLCAVSKQMINAADVMMRYEKAVKDGMDAKNSVLKGVIAREANNE